MNPPTRTRSLLVVTVGLGLGFAGNVACPGNENLDAGWTGSAPSMSTADIVDDELRVVPLVCPGARGCESSTGDLRAGAAARVITPAVETWTDTDGNGRQNGTEPYDDLNNNGQWDGVFMAGFDIGRTATGVHDDQWCRALVVETRATRVGFVSLDLVGYMQPDVINLRLAAQDAALALDHVVVASTHNHETKDAMGIWGPDAGTSGYDPVWMAHILEQCVAALTESTESLTPATLRVGQSKVPAYLNDTREPIVVDDALTALGFADADGATFATAVIYGNHPEALGSNNTLLTSDYPDRLRRDLEAHYPGSTSVFLSGSLGGLMTMIGATICPDDDGADTCPQGTFERSEAIGAGLAAAAIAILDDPAAHTVALAPRIEFRRAPIYIPGDNYTFLLAFKLGLLSRHGYSADDEYIPADVLLDYPIDELTDGKLKVGTEVSAVRIGPVEILSVPGELYPEVWLSTDDGDSLVETPEGADFPDAPREPALKPMMSDASIKAILNNSGDALGYFIPKPQFDKDDPRAYRDNGQYGEQNCIGPDAAAVIAAGVETLYALEVE